MVRSIILCEGETDQVLLGNYLEKVADWIFTKNMRDNPFPKEPINWYTKPDSNIVGIWRVNGDDFSKALTSVFCREKLDHSINHVVIITDHDDQTAECNRLAAIQDVIETFLDDRATGFPLSSNQWCSILFQDSFQKTEIQFLYLLVPVTEYGALETYMLNAISEQCKEKEHVIEESRKFIDGFQSNFYLKHRREKIKAELGVSLSIFSPDRIFTTMKELIDSVEWDKFSGSHKQFDILSRLF